jgi:hypothetical protein
VKTLCERVREITSVTSRSYAVLIPMKSDTMESTLLLTRFFMKTKLLFVSVLCLFFFSATGFAQSLGTEMAKTSTKIANRAEWNGAMYFVVGMLVNPEFREAWNVSDEQHQQIEDITRGVWIHEYRKIPEYRTIEKEMRIQMSDPLMRNADEKTRMDKILEFEERLSVIRIEVQTKALDNLLTAEQKQKIREYQLADMSRQTFFPAGAFEALGLTDGQREQIEIIKKEFEPEFETSLEDYVSGRHRELGRKYHGLVEQMGLDKTKYHHAVHNKLMAEDPVYQRLHNEVTSQRERFVTQFKIKIFDVLTDEQWNRLQKLIDDPPEYLKAFRKKIADAVEKSQTWTPGPDSWQPGDPIPEHYRQERNMRSRFPRVEN